MKTQQEIVIKAKEYAESIGNEDGLSAFDYAKGYNDCQSELEQERKAIAKKVWYDIFSNNTLTYNSFEEYYNDKIKNYEK